jgi:hypothetical protein
MKHVPIVVLLLLYLTSGFTAEETPRPLVTFYRERFGPVQQENYNVWRLSLQLQKPVAESHTYFIGWKINFTKAAKHYRLDFKDSIQMVAGQIFRTKELYMPYDKDDAIQDVKLFQEEQEIPVDVKFKR